MMVCHTRRAVLSGRMYRSKYSFQPCSRKFHSLNKEIFPSADNMPLAAIDWDFHLLERSDVNQAVDLILSSIASNYDDYGLGGGGLSIFNMVVIKLGILFRSRDRLKNPSMVLSDDSFILAATARGTTEIAAIVEISLLNPDGRFCSVIPNPFRSTVAEPTDEPYLFNLCVAKAHRKKGLGKLMCEVTQELVLQNWKKDRMYLHCYKGNLVANNLYNGMGYKTVPSQNIEIVDTDSTILHYCSHLKRSWTME